MAKLIWTGKIPPASNDYRIVEADGGAFVLEYLHGKDALGGDIWLPAQVKAENQEKLFFEKWAAAEKTLAEEKIPPTD